MHHETDPTQAEHFSILTHNGCITMFNPATDGHRTVRIRTQKDDAKFCPGQRIVSLRVGEDWESFGFVGMQVNEAVVNVWRSKRGQGRDKSIHQKLAAMLKFKKHYEDLGVEYMVEGTCRICNRALTNPVSIESGIGPVCAGRS